jgi:hypothetical protein
VVEAWKVIMQLRHEPAALALTRQALPTLDRTKYAAASGVAKGAYVLADAAGGMGKQIVHTLVEREGKARSHHVANISGKTLRPSSPRTLAASQR